MDFYIESLKKYIVREKNVTPALLKWIKERFSSWFKIEMTAWKEDADFYMDR